MPQDDSATARADQNALYVFPEPSRSLAFEVECHDVAAWLIRRTLELIYEIFGPAPYTHFIKKSGCN